MKEAFCPTWHKPMSPYFSIYFGSILTFYPSVRQNSITRLSGGMKSMPRLQLIYSAVEFIQQEVI